MTSEQSQRVPIKVRSPQRDGDSNNPVWIRIGAFLSGRSPATQDTYSGVLREWCAFLKSEIGSARAAQAILSATDLHAAAYRNWLEGRPGETPRTQKRQAVQNRERAVSQISSFGRREKKRGLEATQANATIAKKFAILRRLYRVLLAAGLLNKGNPFDSDLVPAPPKDAGRKRPTEMLEYAQVKAVLALPDQSQQKGLRDLGILSVMFGGGLRRSEVLALRLSDVRSTRAGTIFLRLRATKAKKDVDQALPKWAALNLLRHVAKRKELGAAVDDYLFTSYSGRGGQRANNAPLSTVGLYKLFKDYCRRAGVSSFASPHSARATAITRLLDEGISHREVKEFSRHASIQMVELYDKRRIGVDENPAKLLEY